MGGAPDDERVEFFDCDGESEVREEEQSDNDGDDSSDDCEREDLENEDNSLYSHDQPMTSSNLDLDLKALNYIKKLVTKKEGVLGYLDALLRGSGES